MVSETFLKECDIFSGLNDDQLKKLIPISKEKTYAPGTLLYRIGDPSTHLNLVEKGKVFLQMIADMGPAVPPMYLPPISLHDGTPLDGLHSTSRICIP